MCFMLSNVMTAKLVYERERDGNRGNRNSWTKLDDRFSKLRSGVGPENKLTNYRSRELGRFSLRPLKQSCSEKRMVTSFY